MEAMTTMPQYTKDWGLYHLGEILASRHRANDFGDVFFSHAGAHMGPYMQVWEYFNAACHYQRGGWKKVPTGVSLALHAAYFENGASRRLPLCALALMAL